MTLQPITAISERLAPWRVLLHALFSKETRKHGGKEE